MQNFLLLHKKGEVPLMRPSWMGTYDPSMDRIKASNPEKCRSDTGLLADMVITLKPVTQVCSSPVDDELMKGTLRLRLQVFSLLTLWRNVTTYDNRKATRLVTLRLSDVS